MRRLAILLGVLVLVALVAGLWLRGRVEASLPRLEGELSVPNLDGGGLQGPVSIERDVYGIPVLRGESRRDVAFATGFAHAQDRFFQMDLLRRRSAGELAELIGSPLLDTDLAARRHRFRVQATRLLDAAAPDVRDLVEAYSAGVNAGLASLDAAPWEYLVLRSEPRAWQPVDSYLVTLTMFMQLQDASNSPEEILTLMHELLPPALYDFLSPWGTEWDTPLVGDALPGRAIPSAKEMAQSSSAPATDATPDTDAPAADPDAGGSAPVPGSNAWALAGSRADAGGAGILANDLHLDLSVPNSWYRAAFVWSDATGEHRIDGATLPGTPAMVVGSNGRVAWGVTNSVIDTRDLILLETAKVGGRDGYLTPDGPEAFEVFAESIPVRGEIDYDMEVRWTRWGPVISDDALGRPRAVRWVAHLDEAVDLEIVRLETATSTQEALDLARRSGSPALTLVAADAEGHLGWTLLGRVPDRPDFDDPRAWRGRRAVSWADGRHGWEGLAPPEAVPAILDPESGQIWSANNRLVSGEALQLLGDGNYDVGARARQIQQRLNELPPGVTAQDMLAIQLDDEARFLERWALLLRDLLTAERIDGDPRRQELRDLLDTWDDEASIDSADYRVVRALRYRLASHIFDHLTAACIEVDEDFDYILHFRQFEGPLWQLVQERPAHLLPTGKESWEAWMLEPIDELLATYAQDGRPLAEKTWGSVNRSVMRHPLSFGLAPLPLVGERIANWIDMPRAPMAGDEYMPRVGTLSFGATLRMAVAPGREDEAYFHMPGGQSGHPMSPHYRDGWDAWIQGQPQPFLAGAAVHTLKLQPAP